jgi:hypothetical protein
MNDPSQPLFGCVPAIGFDRAMAIGIAGATRCARKRPDLSACSCGLCSFRWMSNRQNLAFFFPQC